MVEVSLTVGKLDASLALLLTKDHHLIEFPTILLPNGVKAGSIVKIKCDQDFETEKEEARQFSAIQDEILSTFGTNLPQNPVLKPVNVTQTSCVLEWDPLELGTASLKNLFLFKDGKKLGTIPLPLTNRVTKLSGLPIDKTFNFQLRLDTTAGVYLSEIIEVTTHKMTDLSGITVCLGDITANDQFTVDDIQATLKNMGAHYPAQDKVKVDTTHFICTRENKQNPEFVKASDMNIPIIRPEWLKACERDRRIVGVRDYYVKDCVLPDIFAKNFWQKSGAPSSIPPQEDAPVNEPVAHNTSADAVEPASEAAEHPIHEINLEKQVPDVPVKDNGVSEEPEDEKTLPIPQLVEGAELPLIAEDGESSEPVIEAATEAPVVETEETQKQEEAEEAQENAEDETEAKLEQPIEENALEAVVTKEPEPTAEEPTLVEADITESSKTEPAEEPAKEDNTEVGEQATSEPKETETPEDEGEDNDEDAEGVEATPDAAAVKANGANEAGKTKKKKNKKNKNKK